eukprot:CAMPEP_0175264502 /NCGR_PEP_ID=MMETSP0093-20121207/42340_1 /TAXON_ID=311494 /ORGANISM="Alexandrium monilatum, Strain CCMP3105" /LENGTH=76 /DNA_ID=CAMNT_0016559057 /DNA_START=49 /DNA_END=275 /DNA_ORIENTATION=+
MHSLSAERAVLAFAQAGAAPCASGVERTCGMRGARGAGGVAKRGAPRVGAAAGLSSWPGGGGADRGSAGGGDEAAA